jgi:uncharacterized membrane protein
VAVTAEPVTRATHRFSFAPPRITVNPAVLVLSAVVAAWIVTFSVLAVRRHHGFWDIDFDMGIHDQSVWLLSEGRGFLTVRGLQVFGHHASPGYFFLVPAYWLGAGPDFLNVLQVVVLGLGAVPLYLLARERRLPAWVAAVLGAVLLLHPVSQFYTWELFHPEVMAITPLLCAYLCAERRSWRWFAFWCVIAVSWKEDVALAVVMLGLLVAFRGNRKVGLATMATSLGWFLLWALVLFPAINDGHLQSENLYLTVGGSAGGIVETFVTDPGEILSRVFSSESGDFAWHLALPFGLVAPLLAPVVLLIGLPQYLLDVISDAAFTRTYTFHYGALPLVALALATVEGIAFASRRFGKTVALAAPLLVLSTAMFGTLAWGLSPVGAEYDSGYWPPTHDPRIESKREAVALVPDDGVVSAVYGLVPQFSRRAEIYSFPNPWESRNFGIDGKPRRDPRRVEWLVIDRTVLGPPDAALLRDILESGEFRIVFARDDLLVARRH